MTQVILDDHMDDIEESDIKDLVKELEKLDDHYLAHLAMSLLFAIARKSNVPPFHVGEGLYRMSADPLATLAYVLLDVEEEE